MNKTSTYRKAKNAFATRLPLAVCQAFLLISFSYNTFAQVSVTATGGTTGPTAYTTLKLAFDAVNAGTHTGSVIVEVGANTAETAPAVLNSSGVGSASYTDLLVRPSADGISITGATVTGRGLIELNAADNVTIDGDNPNTPGVNRNLTITNTAANTVNYTSAIRLAVGTAATFTSADNNIITNLIINGSGTGLNASGTTSTTGPGSTTFGVVAGPGGAATPTALASVSTAMGAATTVNVLQITNCAINQCGRGILFLGAAAASSTGITISNNTIGAAATLTTYPYTTPTTSVYVKGIFVQGTTAVTITNNTVQNILSYISGSPSGIELNANIGTGAIIVSGNTVSGVAYNGTTSTTAKGINIVNAGAPYTVSNNIIRNIRAFGGSGNQPQGINLATSAASAIVENNEVSTVYNHSTATWGSWGINLNGGNNITVRNNFVSDINQDITAGSAFDPQWNVCGVRVNAGTGHNIVFNSVHLTGSLFGTPTASHLTSAFAIQSTSYTGITVKNNIFSNNMTGGTTSVAHVSIFLPSGATSTMNLSIDNNAYFSGTGPTQGLAQVGTAAGTGFYMVSNFDPANTSNATNFRTYTSTLGNNPNDAASKGLLTTPPFVSTTNLHIPNGTSTALESSASNIGVTTDIDNQTRPGPTSAFGFGTAPDIGADEFDGIFVDGVPPTITYTPVLQTCLTGNRTITVTITDPAGIPLTGLIPVIYWKVGAGPSYVSAQGVNTGGTATSSTWDFTITGTFAVGDIISYFIVAQDIYGQVAANPGTGIVATDVNTVTTYPTNPNTYVIGSTMAGTFQVGTGQVSPNFPTLTAAIAAYNQSCPSGPIVYELTDNLYGAGESFPLSIGNPFASAINTLTIRPSASLVGNAVITSSNAVGTMGFDGADYVTIDGRPGGVGSSRQLHIVNTNNAGVAFGMINDATNNLITYCDLQGQNTVTAPALTTPAGVIYIGGSGTSAQTGNDNNTISFCDIHGPTGANPAIGIAAIGMTTNAGSYNENITIDNCSIFDVFAAAANSTGIKVDAGNGVWTVSNNSFYQTAPRVFTSNVSHRAMHINSNSAASSTMTPQGSGFSILNNYIGGNSPLAPTSGGNYDMSNTSTTASTTTFFFGMDISVGVGAPTTVQGNVIRKFAISNAGASATTPSFTGISINYGNLVVNQNVVGDPLNNGSITVTKAGTSTTATTVMPIRISGGTTITTSNNTVAGITAIGLATGPASIIGIHVAGGTTNTVSNNTIGSTTIANSIIAPFNTTANASLVTGINIAGGTNATVSGNTVANISNSSSSSSASAQVRGIVVSSSTLPTVTGNTVFALSAANANTGVNTGSSVLGLQVSSSSAGATVSGNTIHSLINTNTTAANVNVIGLFVNSATTGTNMVSKNFIHSLNTTATGTTATLTGMEVGAGQLTVDNNMVRLGVDASGADITLPLVVRGISHGATTLTGSNFYHNTVYVGGANVATTPATVTYAFHKNSGTIAGSENIRNNIFVNARSNASSGGGKHYAIYFTGNATNIGISNNIYHAPGVDGLMGFDGVADVVAYASGWAAGDINSFLFDPVLMAPNGSATTLDLHVNSAVPSPAESGAMPIAGITDDFDGNTRNVSNPDIGADEFSGTTPAPVMLTSPTPANPQCTATARTITATVTSISPVTSVVLNYNNGAAGSTPMTLTTGTSTNGTWTATLPAASPANSVVTWNVVASNGGFTTTEGGASYQDAYLTNVVTTATATPGTICSGDPSTLSVIALDGAPGTATIGTQTTTEQTNAPYRSGLGSPSKHQYLYLASELTAAGFAAGNLSSIAFNITTLGTGTLANYTISLKTTSATVATSTFDPGSFATVFTSATITPTAGLNTYTFTTPFYWDGTSNILLNICYDNPVIGGSSTVAAATMPSARNVSLPGAANACAAATGTTTAVRPLTTFGGVIGVNHTSTMTWTWNPGTISGVSPTVTPTVNETYTATGVDANGCSVTSNAVTVTVNPAPTVAATSGNGSMCIGSTTTLTNITGGGVWSTSDAAIATVSTTGDVTGVSAGSATIRYTVTDINTGCSTVVNHPIVVNPLPTVASTTGNSSVCLGSTTTLNNTTPGGAWATSDAAVATVSATGVVTGLSTGSANITYTVTTSGCSTTVAHNITVDPLPTVAPITGNNAVCVGSNLQLANATSGGVWISSNTAAATVDANGLVTALSAGSSTISYSVTDPVSGCSNSATHAITINALPTVSSITGNGAVCVGSSTMLSSATSGGTWSSSNTGVATVDPATGNVTGVTAGSATISYTVTSTGCITTVTHPITVDPLPTVAGITGNNAVCVGSETTLSSTTSGGIWNSSNTSVASVTSAGDVKGVSAGTATISYSVTSSGCSTAVSQLVTVNAMSNSLPSSTSSTLTQEDGTVNTYSSTSCQPIVTIQDANGGVALGSVTASVTDAGSPQIAPGGEPYVERYYTITAGTTSGLNATVTLYATDAEFAAYNSHPASALYPPLPTNGVNNGNVRVTKFATSALGGPGNPGTLITPTVTWNAANSWWEISFPVTSLSSFYIHSNISGFPLDIELRNISAVNVDNRNRVDWTTVNEVNADRFELERSADGVNFAFLGVAKAKGESSTYSYWDENPIIGLNYYRLKMFDRNGEHSFSKTVSTSLRFNEIFYIEAYPNPVTDKLIIRIAGAFDESGSFVVADIAGKQILKVKATGVETTINMTELASGMYYIRYNDNLHSRTTLIQKK